MNVPQIVIVCVGATVCVLAAWGIYAPNRLLKLVIGAMEKDWGIYLAVIVRLLLGLALILAAPESRFPSIFRLLGWIAIVAAVGMVFLGRARMRGFIAWFERFPPTVIRLWLLFGIAFGGFLVFGIV